MLTDKDLKYLRRCVELAETALDAGNPPFGSLLVDAQGTILAEDHNQIMLGDQTHHPELTITRWASNHLSPSERASTTVYTSGEHCPMCSAAHGWVGLGRIVYASSAAQLSAWMSAWGVQTPAVQPLPIQQVLPGVQVDGPAPALEDKIRELQRRYFKISK